MKNYYLIPIMDINNYKYGLENYISKMYSELDSLVNQLETLNKLSNINESIKKQNIRELTIKINKALGILPKYLLFKEISRANGYITLEECFTKLRIKSMLSEVELNKISEESAIEYISNTNYTDKMLIINDFSNFVSGFHDKKDGKTIEFKR